MLKNYKDALEHSVIFRSLEPEKLEIIFDKVSESVKEYKKGETINHEDDNCNALSVVLEGKVELQTVFPSGKVFTLVHLAPGDGFGEAVLFSSTHKYPVSAVSLGKSKVIEIPKEKLLDLFIECPQLMENFLSLLSNKLISS